MKLFVFKFICILDVLRLQGLQKNFLAHFHDYVSKNEAVFREVQTHLGSFWPARFAERILDAITRFMRPNAELFAVKFRRILGTFRLARFVNKVLVVFSLVCVQIRNCLP